MAVDQAQIDLEEEQKRKDKQVDPSIAAMAAQLGLEEEEKAKKSADKGNANFEDLDALRAQLIEGKDNGKKSGAGLQEIHGDDLDKVLSEPESTGLAAIADGIKAKWEAIKDIPADISDALVGGVHGAKAGLSEMRPEILGGVGSRDEDGRYSSEIKAEAKLDAALERQGEVAANLVKNIDAYKDATEKLQDPEKTIAAIEEATGKSLDAKAQERVINALEKQAERAGNNIDKLTVDLDKAEARTDKLEARFEEKSAKAAVAGARRDEQDKAADNIQARVEKREAMSKGQDIEAEMKAANVKEVAGLTKGGDAIDEAKEARKDKAISVSEKLGDAVGAAAGAAATVTGVNAAKDIHHALTENSFSDDVKDKAAEAKARIAESLSGAVPSDVAVDQVAQGDKTAELTGAAAERAAIAAKDLDKVLSNTELPPVNVAQELANEALAPKVTEMTEQVNKIDVKNTDLETFAASLNDKAADAKEATGAAIAEPQALAAQESQSADAAQIAADSVKVDAFLDKQEAVSAEQPKPEAVMEANLAAIAQQFAQEKAAAGPEVVDLTDKNVMPAQAADGIGQEAMEKEQQGTRFQEQENKMAALLQEADMKGLDTIRGGDHVSEAPSAAQQTVSSDDRLAQNTEKGNGGRE